jgi:ABC-type microcin C transport system permease subunit YejB
MTKLSIKKFSEPDFPIYKKVADYFLYIVLPFAQTSIAGAVVADVMTTKQAYWSGLFVSFAIINLKIVSKFVTKKK